MLDRRIVFYALICLFSGQLFGGELTPYRLPSETAFRQQQSMPQLSVNAQSKEDYYRAFELKVRGLSQSDKNKLINEFSIKQNMANSYDEAQHYFHLGEILKRGSVR